MREHKMYQTNDLHEYKSVRGTRKTSYINDDSNLHVAKQPLLDGGRLAFYKELDVDKDTRKAIALYNYLRFLR